MKAGGLSNLSCGGFGGFGFSRAAGSAQSGGQICPYERFVGVQFNRRLEGLYRIIVVAELQVRPAFHVPTNEIKAARVLATH